MVRLTSEQKQFYQDNGYIILKNVLPAAELDRIAEEYDKLFARKNQEKMESPDSPPTVKTIYNLQYHHAVFGKLLFNETLLDAVEDVLCTENIVLHHTKGHSKPPGKEAAYPMHQDYHHFPYEKHSMIGAFLHLDVFHEGNGGLFVHPGSHKLGPLESVGQTKDGHLRFVDQARFPLEKAVPVVAERGDIIVFSYLLVHGSSANCSTGPRRLLLIQMVAEDDRPVGKQPLRPCQGMLLRGVNSCRDVGKYEVQQL